MYEIDDYEVLEVEEVTTETQTVIIKKHHIFLKKLTFVGGNTTSVNIPLSITVSCQKFNLETGVHEPDLAENSPIRITVTGSGEADELILEPVDGQASFDFVSPTPGTFKITALGTTPSEAGEMEVFVNE